MKGEVEDIATAFARFVENEESVYGFRVVPETVKDTLLITTSRETDRFPTTAEYYSLIDTLRSYAAERGASETNYPMLHITPADNRRHLVRVAVPVDRVLSGKGPIQFKRMVPGNILTVEWRGGIHSVMTIMQLLDTYISEHRFRSPAIPFQSLVTDRRQQPDTTQWLTKIYYPVL